MTDSTRDETTPVEMLEQQLRSRDAIIDALTKRLIALEAQVSPSSETWLRFSERPNGVRIERGAELLEGKGRAIVFGRDVKIFRHTEIIGPVTIGDGTFVNRGCLIQGDVQIGSKVSIGPRVQLLSATHKVGPSEHRAGAGVSKPVVIGDGVWIGAGAIILPGVSVAPGAIIAAGAVVSEDVQPDVIVGGVPARVLRHI